MIDLQKWSQLYQQTVLALFGKRVLFIGLQGSYARHEATNTSDIDVVLILDQVNFADLKLYKEALNSLPEQALICGFVSGKEELLHWTKFDLFQFYYDTVAWYGNLADLIPKITVKEARQAVLVGACNLYHATSHNFLHAADPAVLQALYKTAFFVLQAKYYSETGSYINQRSTLAERLNGMDRAILEAGQKLQKVENLAAYSELLLKWSSSLIIKQNF